MQRLMFAAFIAFGLSFTATAARADFDGIPCGVVMNGQLEAIAEENGGSLPADVQEVIENLTANIPANAGPDDEAVCEASREFTSFLESRQ